MSADATGRSRLREALTHWDVGQPRSLVAPDTGTINQTTIVDTDSGRFVLRQYAHRDPDRIPLEHDLIRWVAEQGIPAPCPVETREGRTWIEVEDGQFALFPFATGEQTSREDLSEAQIGAMGRFLADLHATLKGYPTGRVRQRDFTIDPDLSLQEIDRLSDKIRRRKSTDPQDGWALERLDGRRDWILRGHTGTMDEFMALTFQTTHGDYQESNLFFCDDRISAIIDWEQAYAAPPGHVVLRAMHLSLSFQPQRCHRFLSAYRERNELDTATLDVCAAAYALLRGHSLWLFEEIYDQGNDRLRRFLFPSPFVPVEQQWARLRPALVD